MEVVVQKPSSPTMDNFDFGGNVKSIYQSAPSSPKRFGEYYLSAPASPSRLSELYNEFEYFSSVDPSSSFEAANKADDGDENNDYSFAFYVNDDKSSRSAEELFDGGKIKPFKPLNESRSKEPKRGRERERASTTTTLSSSNSGRRAARSHSPYRKSSSQYAWEAEQQQQQQQPRSIKEESNSCSKGSRRWWLKDFLLFRSASEGRGSSKDPLKKYYSKKNNGEEVKGSSSFRSSESRKKGPVSAHELHYAMKRAESEDMKKKTFLPYRQGILGRLAGFGL